VSDTCLCVRARACAGVHKRQGFASATVCLFVFDIMVLNGASRQLVVLPFRRLGVLHDVVSVTAPQASA
jgi:hypothetical protein